MNSVANATLKSIVARVEAQKKQLTSSFTVPRSCTWEYFSNQTSVKHNRGEVNYLGQLIILDFENN